MGLTTGGNERGCQDGDHSYLPSVLVMFVRPLPSGFITKRSPLPKMIFVPSGDHAEAPGQGARLNLSRRQSDLRAELLRNFQLHGRLPPFVTSIAD